MLFHQAYKTCPATSDEEKMKAKKQFAEHDRNVRMRKTYVNDNDHVLCLCCPTCSKVVVEHHEYGLENSEIRKLVAEEGAYEKQEELEIEKKRKREEKLLWDAQTRLHCSECPKIFTGIKHMAAHCIKAHNMRLTSEALRNFEVVVKDTEGNKSPCFEAITKDNCEDRGRAGILRTVSTKINVCSMKCPNCGRLCNNYNALRTHVPSHNISSKDLRKYDPFELLAKEDDRIRLRKMHEDSISAVWNENNKRYRCPQCQRIYKGIPSIKQHIRTIHQRKTIAKEIKKMAVVEDDREMHDESLSAPKSNSNKCLLYRCSECPRVCIGIPGMKQHMRIIHKRMVTAEEVKKMVVVEDERENVPSARFVRGRKRGLLRGLIDNRGLNRFCCSHCGQFVWGYRSMQTHLRFRHAIKAGFDEVWNMEIMNDVEREKQSENMASLCPSCPVGPFLSTEYFRRHTQENHPEDWEWMVEEYKDQRKESTETVSESDDEAMSEVQNDIYEDSEGSDEVYKMMKVKEEYASDNNGDNFQDMKTLL